MCKGLIFQWEARRIRGSGSWCGCTVLKVFQLILSGRDNLRLLAFFFIHFLV